MIQVLKRARSVAAADSASAATGIIADGPAGAAVEEVVAGASTQSGETRSAELAFALAALTWLWRRDG